jgi:hypothetical protein
MARSACPTDSSTGPEVSIVMASGSLRIRSLFGTVKPSRLPSASLRAVLPAAIGEIDLALDETNAPTRPC